MNRHERRARDADIKRAVKRGESTVAGIPGLDDEVRQVAERFRAARTLPLLEDAVRVSQRNTDHIIDRMVVRTPELERPACQAGCSYCCHVHVSVSAPEVIAAVEYARGKLDAPTLGRVSTRAAENAARVEGRAPASYPPVPCAFLEDGLCLVHEARPLACRRHHSLDREPCREAFETGKEVRAPINAKVWAAGTGISAAYADGLKKAKVDATIYELQQAASIALGDATTSDRWLAGESVFAAAKSLEKVSFAEMKRRFPTPER